MKYNPKLATEILINKLASKKTSEKCSLALLHWPKSIANTNGNKGKYTCSNELNLNKEFILSKALRRTKCGVIQNVFIIIAIVVDDFLSIVIELFVDWAHISKIR